MTHEEVRTVRPVGAVFHRCALQVNPHHYAQTFRGKPNNGSEAEYVRAIVDKAVALGISVLAVTDHNDVSSVPAFQAAAQGRGVCVFPGFELSSSDGVHVLCIYPIETAQDTLGRYLGSFGITDTKPSSDPANKSFVDILAQVRHQGGVTIAAHVTGDNGLFKVLSGQARVRAWTSNDLLAIQIPSHVDDLPQDIKPIVQNTNPDYHREPGADRRLAVAALNAKDVASSNDLDDRSASCWIKMSQVGIEGLRQAFLDPGSRVRLNPKSGGLPRDEHVEFLALQWDGGFLDGCAIGLNANLNVLVGGRGTGKSTVVESVRAVLGLDPVGDDAKKAYEGIVRYVLRSGTRIVLRVRTHRPTVREYTIERTLPNPPIVKDDRGNVSTLTPLDVMPRVELYGQHEISELTRSKEKLTHLLDRFAEHDDALPRRNAQLARELEKSRRGLVDMRQEIAQIDDQLAALPGLEETLKRFKEAGLEDKLKEQSLLVREERILASVPERLAPFRESLDILRRETPIDRTFLSDKALDDLPGKEILGRLNAILKQLSVDLKPVIAAMEAAIHRADDGVVTVQKDWMVRKQQVQAAYAKILRELQKSRVDGEEFIRLRQQIESLRPLRARKKQATLLEKEQAARRRGLLVDWENTKAEEFRVLDRAAKKVNRRLSGRVEVQVTATGNREPLFKILREEVGGRLSEAIERLTQTDELSLTQFVEACRIGADEVTKRFEIPPAQAMRLAQSDPETLMRIEELDLPATTTIRLNTAAEGEPPQWQSLEELSTGQKATAVLLLLLLESDAPLIVDQPEDDLDNRFITEGIVPRMREEKERRQFLFSTHNANIPVLGDAEMIIGLAASGEAESGHARITPQHIGSIDDAPVRELVEEILEGGREAFERRRRKYGF